MEDRMIHKSINPYFCLSGLQESQKYGIRGSSTRPVRGGRQTRGCPVANRQTAMPDDGAETEKGISLNFKVSPEFKKEFKGRSEEHTSELQSLMRISYAVFCLKKKKKNT